MRFSRPSLLFLLFIIGWAGCAVMPAEWRAVSPGGRSDVFREIKRPGNAPRGFADLVVRVGLKIPLTGPHALGKGDRKAGYPLLFSVDGQSVAWKAVRVTGVSRGENVPGNPEHGAGIKLALEKRVRLAAGKHEASLGLIEEDYSETVEIEVREGVENILEFKPIYNEMFEGRTRNFRFGVELFEVFLNGRPVK